jgi:carbamoyl-phosphate synthase large subunit
MIRVKHEGSPFNVVISSAGRRVALLEGFKTAMKAVGVEGRVLAIECSPLSAAYHRADASFLVPRCNEDGFIPAVADICQREHVAVIIPTIDPELPVYASNRSLLSAAGTAVHVSGPETVAIGGDKEKTHEWLMAHGFPTVAQWNPCDVPSDVLYPLIVKPRFGSASVGVRKLLCRDDLESIQKTPDLIVQEIAPGKEHTIDVFIDASGRCRCAVPRRRLEVRAGEVSKGVTVREPALERLAASVAEALPGASGVLNMQVFADSASGRLSIIEINARFGGGIPLSIAAGADFPRWVLEETLGLPCTARQDHWVPGVVMLRWDDAVYTRADRIGLRL